ncbi:MAG: DUF177 domain-containing protein [Kiritimatiellae bacterium]|nr:DUF177 domain-containing protein [Kiritimatiellia bacterium]
MIIELFKLRPDGEWFDGEESPEILGVGEDPAIKSSNPIRYHLFAQRASGQLVLNGEVRADMTLQCGRCAEFFSTSVAENSFLRAYEISDATEVVDVTPDIREEILLQVPHFPVCSPECKGLCPQCGANLNLAPCKCQPPDDYRWSALDDVKLN